ncbi:amino acid ABC transporter ATP-binding protein [Streptomyces sp. NPDC002577]
MSSDTIATKDPLLVMRGVHKHFGQNHVLKGIDLEVMPGEVVCLLGPSGSGKSTILRCINQLELIGEGTITYEGDYIGVKKVKGGWKTLTESERAAQRIDIGMVFQRFNLFPHMTVLENVVEGPVQVKRTKPGDAEEIAIDVLGRVGMAGFKDRYPSQLSGGQQQRVAIARALAMDPPLMLFDEPTSALDPELVGEVLDVMKQMAHTGRTMMVVTHEIGFAREVADRIIFMADGAIIEDGPADDVIGSPREERTRQFLASVIH